MTIRGKITKEPDGYIIQGQTPPEVFRILNPAPSRLNKIVKKGNSVQIDTTVVQGSNVNIKSIDEKPIRGNCGGVRHSGTTKR